MIVLFFHILLGGVTMKVIGITCGMNKELQRSKHYVNVDYVNAICSYDLLIIDDLGVESHSDYRMEGLFNVIDRRVRSGKPMIITTNLTIKEMDETQDLNEARIYDRIRAVCQPVQVKGESQRRTSRSLMMERFRGFFNVERKEGSLDDRD